VGWRELVALICPTAKAKYFLRAGWTGKYLTGKSDVGVRKDGLEMRRCIALAPKQPMKGATQS
jgi:hypothetical protein